MFDSIVADHARADERSLIVEMKHIEREVLQANPDVLFLFGDNMARRGYGGQACAMRGEPNAVGIPTKRYPSNQPTAFFRDEDFDDAKQAIDDGFVRAAAHLNAGLPVVLPQDGLGTGLARLDTAAPRIRRYIDRCILRLRALGADNAINKADKP